MSSKQIPFSIKSATCGAVFLLTISAPGWAKPIIDPKGVNQAQYEQDLAECQAIAKQVKVGRKAGAGAVAGAVFGGLAGAAIGNSSTAGRGAGVGSVISGAKGLGRGVGERRGVVRNCLTNRGYVVLN